MFSIEMFSFSNNFDSGLGGWVDAESMDRESVLPHKTYFKVRIYIILYT